MKRQQDMKQTDEWKRQMDQVQEEIPVPESLYTFAAQLPDQFEQGMYDDFRSVTPPSVPRRHPFSRVASNAWKVTSVAAVAAVVLIAGVQMSPAFAAFVKDVPGFSVAIDWLTAERQRDGVQAARNHGYIPIEPVVWEQDGTRITIDDIYLTEEELIYKTYVRTDAFDVADPNGSNGFWVNFDNLRFLGGSTTSGAVLKANDGSGENILQYTYKYQLPEGSIDAFLASGQPLVFQVGQRIAEKEARSISYKTVAEIPVNVDAGKLLHNEVYNPHLRMATGDGDVPELTWSKLTIQPTTMNVIVQGPIGWEYGFPRENAAAPYLEDDKGRIYVYDPSGPGLMLPEGYQQLPFSSSVFFDPDVRSLKLHLGGLTVGEREPSLRHKLDMQGTFPQKLAWKGRDIVIDSAAYMPEGFLHLTIPKENVSQTLLEGVSFDVAEKPAKSKNEQPVALYEADMRKMASYREQFLVSAFGIAEDYRAGTHLHVYIPAAKQDTYTLELRRWNDTVAVDRVYHIPLDRKQSK